jgi:D-inositol-3-phosphate glycosyltransferase
MFHTLGEMKNRIAQSDEEREGSYRIDGEKQVIARVDRIVAATLAERTQLQYLYKANKSKISIIPPGVDTGHFYPIPMDEAREYIGADPNNKLILFVGRIEPLKGLDTLIKAISWHRTFQPGQVTLAVIGGDPDASPEEMTEEMARIQKLCDDLCMGRMVVFLGKRAQETLPYYYSAADVLVMPSHYESFGMVALEAMACGTPVIASQVGGLAFLVQDGETGYHVPDQDPKALCEKLMILLSDPHQRQTMGLRAAEYAKDYAWANIAAQIVDEYKCLVEGKEELFA